jgi:hypothetical protein
MKKLMINYLTIGQYLLIIWSIIFLSSCQLLEPEENFAIKNENTTIAKLEVSFGTSSEFNLSSSNGAYVDLIFQTKGDFNGNVDVYASLNSSENEPKIVSTIESIPSEIKLDIEDIRQAFQNQSAELESGVSLFFTFHSTINGNDYHFNNTALSSSIICNSMISTAEDNWTGTANADNGASFPSTATAENVKIIPLGDDNYLISDISAGWYEAIGFRPQQEGIYNDNCNQLSWTGPGENRQFDFVDPELTGMYDPETQTLTIYWFDAGNEFRGESVFTKN